MKYKTIISNPKILEECRRVLNSEAFQRYILPMLITEHPGRIVFAYQGQDVSAAWQRESNGYERAIGLLVSLLEEQKKKSPIKSTYPENNQYADSTAKSSNSKS